MCDVFAASVITHTHTHTLDISVKRGTDVGTDWSVLVRFGSVRIPVSSVETFKCSVQIRRLIRLKTLVFNDSSELNILGVLGVLSVLGVLGAASLSVKI